MSWNPFKTVHPKTKNGMCRKKKRLGEEKWKLKINDA